MFRRQLIAASVAVTERYSANFLLQRRVTVRPGNLPHCVDVLRAPAQTAILGLPEGATLNYRLDFSNVVDTTAAIRSWPPSPSRSRPPTWPWTWRPSSALRSKPLAPQGWKAGATYPESRISQILSLSTPSKLI